ncbi:hypothetical protein P7K49_025248 [Saguinus oedipus]|uniref:Uncharacterized protein n=1 Tax=Saguinus oedipus TaxID=9490 RepID=A0ABQ9UGJ8_SAGOE|nr:hypothetical protein P7K49_025248 [Saguinus oedipus]
MAAPVAGRGARDFREARTLRLTSEVALEAVSAVELVEDENEEEAAAGRAQSFAHDARVRFLGGRLEMILGFTEEKWSQYLESEDNRQVLEEFLESTSPACLGFSVSAAGRLVASQGVRDDGPGDLPLSPAPSAKRIPRGRQPSRTPLDSRGALTRALQTWLEVPILRLAGLRPTCTHSAVRPLLVSFLEGQSFFVSDRESPVEPVRLG